MALFSFLLISSFSVSNAFAKGLDSKDKSFMNDAAEGGLAEVQIGELASNKASDQDVKNFGARMVKDHSKVNSELQALADKNGITLPTDLNSDHRSLFNNLSNLSGIDFDKKYMSEMVKDHVKDVKDFRNALGTVKDSDLRKFIKRTLPVLEQHLQLAQQIAGKVGA